MATNRFPGKCVCGAHVEAETGTVLRVKAKWVVYCQDCSAPPAPVIERAMNGCIYWPNGMGYTECSDEYEIAHAAMMDAKRALDDAGGDDQTFTPETRALYEAYHGASNAFATLQAEGGHLGERVTFDKPDVMTALLGYGAVNVVPGGGLRVADR